MPKKIATLALIQTAIWLPLLAQAAAFDKVKELLGQVKDIVALLIPLTFAFAVLFFFWGMAKYIWSSGSGKEDGRQIMIWGVVAIFVMTSVWGLVQFLGDTLGLDSEATGKIPTISK